MKVCVCYFSCVRFGITKQSMKSSDRIDDDDDGGGITQGITHGIASFFITNCNLFFF